MNRIRLMAAAAGAALLVALIPATALAADPTRFDVTIVGGGVYRATGDNGVVHEGTLKRVVENSVDDLQAVGGGSVRFAAGTFELGTGFFFLRDIDHIEFAGAGMDATVIRNQSSASSDTEPFNLGSVSHIVIRDLTVSAGGAARTTSDAIDFDNGNDSRVENVKVVASRGRGIVFDGKGVGWSADRNVVRNCVIEGVTSDGIELLAAGSNLITGCRITNTGGHGIQITKSSSVASTPNEPSNDNRLIGNVIDESGQDGVNLNSSSRNEIRDNTITNSADVTAKRDGIRFQSSNDIRCDDNVVAGNRATDTQSTKTQRYGLYISSTQCHRTLVSGNDFRGNATADIRDGGTGTIIETSEDTEPPSVPTGVSATATGPQAVDVAWSAATDDVGVEDYLVRRDGAVIATVAAPALTYADAGLAPGTTYRYTVEAVDAAGNGSGPSAEASVTTPASRTLSFGPVADTYVDAASPTTSRGTSSQLRVDGSPDLRAYLRFDVQGLSGTVESARLRLWANSSSTAGHRVHEVADTTWPESMLYDQAPPLGAVVGSSGSFSSGGYRDVDVTALLTGNGLLSLGVSTSGSTAISYGSRESSNDPQLVVVLVDD